MSATLPPCEGQEVTDRSLLLAYVAAECFSVAEALEALEALEPNGGRLVKTATDLGQQAILAWSLETCTALDGDFVAQVRGWLREHAAELAEMQAKEGL